MKKRCILFPLLTFLLLCFLLIPYATNEEWIKKYNKEIYENNVFAAMGILQPCVASYNEGNVYYKMGSYKLAIKDYKKALKQYPTMKQRCDISTNLALAMVQDIDFEKVNKDNVEETKENLEKAKEVLKKDGFATEDNTGSDPDAQQLLNEINKIIKALDQASSASSSTEKNEKEEKAVSGAEQEQEIKEQYKKLQQSSTNARQKNMGKMNSDEDSEGSILFEGKSW